MQLCRQLRLGAIFHLFCNKNQGIYAVDFFGVRAMSRLLGEPHHPEKKNPLVHTEKNQQFGYDQKSLSMNF